MISIRALLARLLVRMKMRGARGKLTIEELRVWIDKLGDQMPMPQGVSVQPLSIDGIRAEWLTPAGVAEDNVIYYLHGGGYAIGSCRSHRALVASIAQIARARALVIEYRLAPENPFPAGLEDAVTGYQWLLDHGVDAQRIVIAGDSAGGGLSLATMLSLREQGAPLPASAALISPWTDLAGTGESVRTRRRKDPWLQPEGLAEAAEIYAGETDVTHPLVSPVYADFDGLPPMLIQVGNREILLDDSTRIAENARRAGVAVELRIWRGMWHVWHAFFPKVPEAREAIVEMADYIRAGLDASEPQAAPAPRAATG